MTINNLTTYSATMKHIRFFIIAMAAVLSAVSCKSQYEMLLNSNDADLKYDAAFKYFDQEKYQKAAALFESLSVLTNGTERDDTVRYYWGLSNYRNSDYYTAETNFSDFVGSFPRSPFAPQARFLRIDCLYRQTLRYELDQSPTNLAISAINEYIAEYPDNENIGVCRDMLDDLNKRLDTKAYEGAKLYYKMEDYIASRVALRNVLKDNSENVYREDILYYIAMSSYKYAHLSVRSKQKERYLTFIDDYLNFVGELPDSPYRRELDVLYRRAQKELGRPVDTELFDDIDEKDFAKERKRLAREAKIEDRRNRKLLKESEADVVEEAVLDEEEINSAETGEKSETRPVIPCIIL